MARHPESSAFIRYLQNTISDLVTPLEELTTVLRENGEDIPDPLTIFNGAFIGLGLHFGTIDGNLSYNEAAFITDVSEFLVDFSMANMSDAQLLELYQNMLRDNFEFIQNLSVPPPLFIYRCTIMFVALIIRPKPNQFFLDLQGLSRRQINRCRIVNKLL